MFELSIRLEDPEGEASVESSPATLSPRDWNQILRPYKKIHHGKSLFQLLSTAALFVAGWYAMYRSLEVGYWLTLLLAIPMVGFQMRLFIIQHDLGHGAFLRNQKVANAIGFVLGVLTLTPYQYWRRCHAVHHATAGDLDHRELGDVDTLTVEEYRSRSPWGRFQYRFYRSFLTLLVIGPIWQFWVKHRYPAAIPKDWKKERASVWWTNLALVAILAVAWMTVGLEAFLMIELPILFLSASFGVWLFYVQHQFEDTYWERHPEWSYYQAGLEGSSFLDMPRWLHWYTGNIGYHHIHHLSSKVPNYNLRRCMEENPELHHCTRFGLLDSVRCARLKLWDEENKQLIGFRELRQRYPERRPGTLERMPERVEEEAAA
jgi:acyl-lipid omega-6 desaturase (Delta-12 desaturase)